MLSVDCLRRCIIESRVRLRRRTVVGANRILAGLVHFCIAGCAASGVSTQWLEHESDITRLLARMTLEEKLGQLTLLWGGQSEDGNPDVRKKTASELHELIRTGRCGAFLGAHGAAYTDGLQRVAVEQSPHRIPLLFGNDVIHGYHTIFPIPLAEACTWSPELVEKSARIAATEARAAGTHWTFAPMVDIARDARWGRIAEGAGEDPWLGSVIAAARVRGFQGAKLNSADSVLACAKHFVAYGAAEGGRDYNTVDISEQTLREVHLPPFRAAVDAGVGTIMSAFNEINGIPASGHRGTLTDILRGEWGFQGFVVSDWTSVTEMVNHGFAADNSDAAARAILAGVDMDMSSASYRDTLGDRVRRGSVPERVVDQAVRRVLRMKYQLGLFDNPYADADRERRLHLCEAHRSAAREVARNSVVLLKNSNGVLPIGARVRSIAVIGPLADDRREMLGTWAVIGKPGDVIPRIEKSVVTIVEGIRQRAGSGVTVRYARGCELNGGDRSGFAEAQRIAAESDLVILAVGEGRDMSGEAASRSSLELPGVQQALAETLCAAGKPVVAVVMAGRPLSITWISENAAGVLNAWHLGTEAGHAVADLLFGDASPSGRLAVTIPRNVGQAPIYYAQKNTGRPPTDQKYTSKYIDVPWTPLYPFGFGLSYTTLEYSNLRISRSVARPGESIEISAQITNTGSRSGIEVAQLYVRDVVATMTRPVRQLKGFQRVDLAAGASRTVTFSLPVAELGFYDSALRYRIEPGTFRVWIGPSSTEGLEGSFEVAGG